MVEIYVDGSFNTQLKRAGWGFCVVEEGKIIHESYGLTDYIAKSRNIDGECEAAYQAIKWANKYYVTEPVIIVYDYLGIERWAVKKWKAKTAVSKRYVDRLAKLKLVNISFCWVKGHSGNEFNERADKLADFGKKLF